jgi:hypothetical protein
MIAMNADRNPKLNPIGPTRVRKPHIQTARMTVMMAVHIANVFRVRCLSGAVVATNPRWYTVGGSREHIPAVGGIGSDLVAFKNRNAIATDEDYWWDAVLTRATVSVFHTRCATASSSGSLGTWRPPEACRRHSD